MLKRKKFVGIVVMILVILGIYGNTLAADKQTSTSEVNNITANWEYEINASNQIEELKYQNPTELVGNIEIPKILDGKTVVGIGDNAFKGAKELTGVVIPNSIKKIGNGAFRNCVKINNVDLGNVEEIKASIFKGCTSLKEITIPKTVKVGPVLDSCLDNSSITKITLEEGMKIIPDGLCGNTGITEITIPESVETIGCHAFMGTELTEVKIPKNVKLIDGQAFFKCTKLKKIDLGNVEEISFGIVQDCTSLTEITIPKTVKKGSTEVPCLDNPNITKVTLEEGITIVPNALLANTGITEITIPNTVTEIQTWAFYNCTNLKKITIPDSVVKIAQDGATEEEGENVFENHNEDLTIYCYEGSAAAEYAKKYNIKYVYITKPIEDNKDKIDQENSTTGTKANEKINDLTIATVGKLPKAGANTIIVIIILLTIIAGVMLKKYNDYKDIK